MGRDRFIAPCYIHSFFLLFFFSFSSSLSMCVWVCLILVLLTVVPICFLSSPHIPPVLPPTLQFYIYIYFLWLLTVFLLSVGTSVTFFWHNPIHTSISYRTYAGTVNGQAPFSLLHAADHNLKAPLTLTSDIVRSTNGAYGWQRYLFQG
jgi:hypothetical protein